MKINAILTMFMVAILLSGCGHSYLDQHADQPGADSIHAGWEELPLVALGENVALRMPDTLLTINEVRWNGNFGRLEIEAGPSLDMVIMETREDVEYKKFELGQGIFEITYFEEEADRIRYKASLPDGTAGYHHFYMTIDLGSRKYQVESNPLVEFSEKDVEVMLAVAGTIIEKSH